MSTGYSWEDIRQVRATLLGARAMYLSAFGGQWPCLLGALYQVLSTFTFIAWHTVGIFDARVTVTLNVSVHRVYMTHRIMTA